MRPSRILGGDSSRARLLAAGGAIVLVAVGVTRVPIAAHAGSAAGCPVRWVRPLVESPEGTATQAVVFVAIRNSGVACDLKAKISFGVLGIQHRFVAVSDNPLNYHVSQDLKRGKTALFDVWWSNWCGSRRPAAYTARVVLGHHSASVRYTVLPVCLSRTSRSRLTLRAQSEVADAGYQGRSNAGHLSWPVTRR